MLHVSILQLILPSSVIFSYFQLRFCSELVLRSVLLIVPALLYVPRVVVLRCLGLKFSASFSQVREARVLYFKFICVLWFYFAPLVIV